MARFFVSDKQLNPPTVTITGGDARHLTVVLRHGPGDTVQVVGPDGTEYRVRLTRVDVGEVRGEIVATARPQREPRLAVTLVQALLKADRFDWVVQKGTEVGMARLVPLQSARTIVRPRPEQLAGRRQRWQRIATAAAQQSGRSRVPVVDELHDLPALAAAVRHLMDQGGLTLLAWEGEGVTGLHAVLADTLADPATDGSGDGPIDTVGGASADAGGPRPIEEIMVIIGPEGGFEQEEVQALVAAGARSVSLGPLIFRADTAGPACLIMILYHGGDLGRAPRR